MGGGNNNTNRRRCSHYSNGSSITITLLPMLCSKPSIKEVIVPAKWQDRRRISGEPLSPRVGCMGQVVKKNSRVVGHPTPTPLHTANPNKYLKLPKIFSTVNLKSRRVDGNQEQRRTKIDGIYIADMDPPLPVVRKIPPPELESFWKRRSKGRDTLHIQVAKSNLFLFNQQVLVFDLIN